MPSPLRILIMGASYGSLLATKLLLAGHTVKLVCLPAEAELINAQGTRVRMPVKGRDGLVEIDSRKLPGKLSADGPAAIDPADYDLVALAMQEPQYRSAGVRELLDAIAGARLPCMSIMNMPPLPYLARIPGIDPDACRDCYTDATVWDRFDPSLMTLCSPDPQAFRPPDEKVNVLQVRLPTNFKSARFAADAHSALLRRLEADIEAARFDSGGEKLELPVKLKVHESVFVPLAKWAMLMAATTAASPGRACARSTRPCTPTSTRHARCTTGWSRCAVSLGADARDLVPFEKYAAAAKGLTGASSAARALYGGAPYIERVDRLVQTIAAQKDMRSAALDEVVALVDAQLEANRKAARS